MDERILDFKCGECGKILATLDDLKKHEREAHPDRQVRREDEEERPQSVPSRLQ